MTYYIGIYSCILLYSLSNKFAKSVRQKTELIEVIFRFIGSIHDIQKCKFGIRDIDINLFLDATV